MKLLIISILLLTNLSSLYAQSYYTMKKEAKGLFKHNKKEAAIKVVKDFLQENPKSLHAKNLLAVLYYWDKDYKHSKELLVPLAKKNNFKQAKRLLAKIEKLTKSTKSKVYKKLLHKKRVKKENIDINDALNQLQSHYQKKEFDRYYNLYKRLLKANSKLPKETYATALYVSVVLSKFDDAKHILNSGILPKSKKTEKLRAMILRQEKIAKR